MLEQLNIHIENRNLERGAQKLNPKWVMGLSTKPDMIKLLKENRGDIFLIFIFLQFRVGRVFLGHKKHKSFKNW